MIGSGGGDSGTSSYLVAARGCWLPTEDNLGENFSYIHYAQVVGNIWLQLGHDLLERCVKLLEREVMRTPTISW